MRVMQKKIKSELRKLKKQGARLIALTAFQEKKEFFLVYHLSLKKKTVNVEIRLPGLKAESVADIFKNAVFYEREAAELFGLDFNKPYACLFLSEKDKPYLLKGET